MRTTARLVILALLFVAFLILLVLALRAQQQEGGYDANAEIIYNKGFELIEEGDNSNAYKSFIEASSITSPKSSLGARARFNRATFLADSATTTDTLQDARTFFEQLLREAPPEYHPRVRRQLEIVIARIRAALARDGNSPIDTERALDPNIDFRDNTELQRLGQDGDFFRNKRGAVPEDGSDEY